jgi:hypothetical protein
MPSETEYIHTLDKCLFVIDEIGDAALTMYRIECTFARI